MTFIKSAINQVGRDLGKVASNIIFEDAHSIPHRSVNRASSVSEVQVITNKFNKAIDFPLSHRPSTLISKLSGAYIVIKNETDNFSSDEYLSSIETLSSVEMFQSFISKISDVSDVFDIDTESNKKEIEQLKSIVKKFNQLAINVFKKTVIGVQRRIDSYSQISKNDKDTSFWKYVSLHIIWMGKYVRGESVKSLANTIVANVLDLITGFFIVSRPFLFLKGIFTYQSFKARRINTKKSIASSIEDEKIKLNHYNDIINKGIIISIK